MSKTIKKNDKVHVKTGLLNYIGVIEEVIDKPNENGYVEEFTDHIYIINGHCYGRNDFKKCK